MSARVKLQEDVRITRKAAQREYDDMPTTATPADFLAGHGNWSLTEEEYARAMILAHIIVNEQVKA